MKILVTGGAGFIASHVVDLYLGEGFEVVVVDDLSTGRLSNLNPKALFYQLDIRSPQLSEIFERERPDIVNHHAAQMNVRRSVAQPVFDADVNILGSLNLIECAVRHKVRRFIYISTGGAVYGEPEYLPCDEAHPIQPLCQYGVSKHTVEHYLFLYRVNYGLEYTILRYPNVYGPRQDPHGEAGAVAIFTGQMLRGQQVTINGDGEQQRDFVFVADCARANLLALQAANGRCVYNLGCGKGTSINEIFGRLKEITGYEGDPLYGPPKVGETRRIYLSAEKARQELGWSPLIALQDGLHQTVEYFEAAEAPTPVRLMASRQVSHSVRGDHHPSTAMRPGEEGNAVDDLRRGSDQPPKAGRKTVRNDPELVAPLESLLRELVDLCELPAALERILEVALGAVGATSGSVLLLDAEGSPTRGALMYAGQLHREAADQLSETLERGLAGWVIRHGQAALVRSTSEDARWLRRPWEDRENCSRSAICAPLVADDRSIGALTLVHTDPGTFSESDLALLVSIAAVVSMADALPAELSASPTNTSRAVKAATGMSKSTRSLAEIAMS